MDSSALSKRPSIRNMDALTANSVNGVLLRDAAAVSISVDPTLKSPTKRTPSKELNKIFTAEKERTERCSKLSKFAFPSGWGLPYYNQKARKRGQATFQQRVWPVILIIKKVACPLFTFPIEVRQFASSTSSSGAINQTSG